MSEETTALDTTIEPEGDDLKAIIAEENNSAREALDFLKIVYPVGPWKLTGIGSNGLHAHTFTYKGISNATRWIHEHRLENLYWQVNPVNERALVRAKAAMEDVTELARLHVDIDPNCTGEEGIRQRAKILELLQDEKRLKEFGIPGLPTIVIDSGNGYWAIWELSIPCKVNDREHSHWLSGYNYYLSKALNNVFGNDKLADHCHNLDRIARLPGTQNFPNESKRKLGRVETRSLLVSHNSELRYKLDDFKWESPGEIRPSKEDIYKRSVSIDDVKYLPDGDPHTVVYDWANENNIHAKTVELITKGEYIHDDPLDPLYNGDRLDRSRAFHRANRALQHQNVPPNLVVGILSDERFPISNHIVFPADARGLKRSHADVVDRVKRQVQRVWSSINLDRAAERGDPPDTEGGNADQPNTAKTLRRMNEDHAVLLQEGGKTRVLSWSQSEIPNNTKRIPVLQTFEDFKNRYCNQVIEVGRDKNNNPIYKQLGKYWLEHPKRTQYLEMRFLPNQPKVVDGYLNLWQGWAHDPAPGDWSLMRDHVFNILAGGNEEYAQYIIKWAAWTVQHPDEPAEVALVFKGGKGCGKGFFGRTMKMLFGQHGMQIHSSAHLVGKFNAHLRDCCLLFADEAFLAGDKKAEGALKGLITEPELPIERKGKDVTMARNLLHIIMASNEDWVIPASADERRYAVFDVSNDRVGDTQYFNDLFEQLAKGGFCAMLYDLLHMDLGSWHPRQDIPQSEALREQKELSLSPMDQCVLEILDSGVIPGEQIDGTISSNGSDGKSGLYGHIRESSPALKQVSHQRLAKALRQLGCSPGRIRINGREDRGWVFPPIEQLRNEWDMKHGKRPWSGLTPFREEAVNELPF